MRNTLPKKKDHTTPPMLTTYGENTDDVIGSILDDPSVASMFRVQSRSVKTMQSGCAVSDFIHENKAYAQIPGMKVKRDYDTWTHILMNGDFGGGFCLDSTDRMEQKFLYAYAHDIDVGVTHYVIERRTKFFKFHADLDIKRKIPMDDDAIITLMDDFTTCVKKFYPSTTALSRFDIVLCTSIGKGKTGIHVIFPNLIVDSDQAMDIRNYFVSFLITKYGDMVGIQNSWEEIVDVSVYNANGLRMVGSNKTEDCSECADSKSSRKRGRDQFDPDAKRDFCSLCSGRGRIDNGKTYKAYMYLRDGKIHPKFTEAMRKSLSSTITEDGRRRAVVELCSIRCPTVNESSSDFAISDEKMAQMASRPNKTGAPGSPKSRAYKQMNTTDGKSYRMSEEDYKGQSKYKQKQYVSNRSESVQMMQEYIQSKGFPKYWQKLYIHDMFSNPKKTYYVCNVRGEGQHYCTNRNGNHKSNNVYFYIDRTGITQKCYCSCQTTEHRRHGKCEDYASPVIPIPTKLEKVLFPVLNPKLGDLHAEHNVSDLDEYTHRIASSIAKLDDDRAEYLEERRQRLNHDTAVKRAPVTEEVPLPANKPKRRRKQPPASDLNVS